MKQDVTNLQQAANEMTCAPAKVSTTFHKSPLAQSVSAILMVSVMGTGHAQVLDEIVVTATKREENIQDVPLAITAFSGDFLRDVNLDDIKDLVSFTPGVTGNSKDSFIDAISIRGIRTQDYGVGGDPSAAFFKNNLYEGRNGAVVSSLYDMERAEVLRGPQAFLFGRNAIGGAFNVHTKRPNLDGARDGYIEVDVAERGYLTVEGGFTVAASDNFGLRIAGYHSEEDGYSHNLFDPNRVLIGHEKTAVRLSGLYGNDKLEVFFSADYEDFERDGTVYTASDLSPRLPVYQSVLGAWQSPADLRNTNQDLSGGNFDGAEITTLGLHVDYDFDSMSLTWSTGYKDHDYLYIEDYDSTPLNVETYEQDQTGSYFQTELRLMSNTDGPLSWYAGASYYREEIDAIFTDSNDEELFCTYYGSYYGVYNCSDYFDYWQDYYDALYYPGYITVGPFVPTANGLMETVTLADGVYTGWAAYVDLTYAFNDQWDVSVGVRYSYDKKDFGLHAQEKHRSVNAIDDPALDDFKAQLLDLCIDLSHQIVRDGEGATKFLTVAVDGAETDAAAKRIAYSIATSPLVKTAVAGEDANWGRIVMAVGKAGEKIDTGKLAISIGGFAIAKDGGLVPGYDETPVAEHMKGQEIDFHVDVGVADGSATVWTCDLTHGYIEINADYRS